MRRLRKAALTLVLVGAGSGGAVFGAAAATLAAIPPAMAGGVEKCGFNIDGQGQGVGNDNDAAATWSADVASPSAWQGVYGGGYVYQGGGWQGGRDWQGGKDWRGGEGPGPEPDRPVGRGPEDYGPGRRLGAADWGGAPHHVNPATGVDWETHGFGGGDRPRDGGGGGGWRGGAGRGR